MANEIPVIPPDMRKVYLRLKRWRSSHARRVPIPDSLWAAAGGLARAHGINPTAKALHLEYGKLKQRAEAAGADREEASWGRPGQRSRAMHGAPHRRRLWS